MTRLCAIPMPVAMDDDLLDTLPLAHRLALSYAPCRAAGDILALLALNQRLGGVLRQASEPVIAQMKLAWWRDRFRQSPEDWPAGEPLLAALARWRGDTKRLEALVDGWEILLAESLGREEADSYAAGHAGAWAALAEGVGSRIDAPLVERSAAIHALADLALNLPPGAERRQVEGMLEAGRAATPRLDRPLRPLAVLRALSLRAVARSSKELLDGPGAMTVALRSGLTGR
ncbi:hypothetical protein [Aurantiacibacter spongiae]|uniref:Phytoene synthase n=1 Tax=Aurantiacibacter spongiae TaxID=2488860 RepID=A0A3N5CN03_9SPHN|nr:hypothetical protein [Aurantiacibacter spongiae]RPF70333.1 hypothetical protein EG799_00820 [Aurantiacibacter spongiae]